MIKSFCVIAQGGKKNLLFLRDTRKKVSDAFKKEGASLSFFFSTAASPAVRSCMQLGQKCCSPRTPVDYITGLWVRRLS